LLDNHIKPTGFEKIQPKKKHSLTEQSLAGFFWMFSAIGIRAVSEMLVVVILARLLTQKDFGVVAAALVVIKVLIIFSQLGIGPAIVQKSHLEDRHIKAAFSLSCLFGFFLTGLIYSIAPNIADFFRMEGLTAVLRIMSLVFSIQSISLTAESLLQREMKFRALSSIEVTSFVLGFGVVGICLAFMKFGIWSLVIAHLSQVFIKTILLLIIKDHPKRVCFERDAVAELMNYGGGFTIARICNSIAGQGDNLVIGRWLGADALGLYGRAYQLMVMPATLFGMALDKVLFPAMAKIQTEQDRLKAVYKKGVALISLVILPISVMIYLLSSEIITVFLVVAGLGLLSL
jgi:PST family polysaccharide transporter